VTGDERREPEPVPRIELRGVAKSFGSPAAPLPVLAGVDLAAAAGELVAVIGPSGCGKSTMFNIIAGLERPDAGEILVDGRPVTGHAEPFAYMPQKDLLFPWRRVLDNTTLGLEVQGIPRATARQRARVLFEPFGLAGFERAYPWQLSGGMRQRAALLRTVVQGREVLLLDEPFGALDSLTRTEMQTWLAAVWERFRWTIVLVTHDIREAVFLADRVHVLTARPARVRLTQDVALGRPRPPDVVSTPEFVAIERVLFDALWEESRRARAEVGEPR
jgi:ABC-type nitrate/sulfonate/bicarbonate transport system ATPase subunit